MSSDFFADKKFEELDWISQAVEPWESPLTEAWAAMPATVDIEPIDFFRESRNSYGFASFHTATRLLGLLKTHEPSSEDHAIGDTGPVSQIFDRFSEVLREEMETFYKIELVAGTTLDMTTHSLSSPIRLIKQTDAIPEALHQKLLIHAARYYGPRYYSNHDNESKRAAEMLELFGSQETSRSGRLRLRALLAALENIFREDKWRIRSAILGHKLIGWVHSYYADGDIAAMANIAKMKVMTHTGKPIYSMTEVE